MKLIFDLILSYKRIGSHPAHVAMRDRAEARLAALKQQGKLYESATIRTPAPASISRATNSEASAVGTSAAYSLVHYWRAGD